MYVEGIIQKKCTCHLKKHRTINMMMEESKAMLCSHDLFSL